MLEQIVSIEEFTERGERYGGMEGYKVTTTEQEITLLIDNGQS